MVMERPDNQRLYKIKVEVARRLAVVVPCIVVIMLFQLRINSNNHWNARTKVKCTISALSGPISSWIEFSGRTTRRNKAFSLVVAPAILLGILSHPIKPCIVTGLVTILSTFFWYVWGVAITCMGV